MTATDAEPLDGAATFEFAGGVDAAMFSIEGELHRFEMRAGTASIWSAPSTL